MLRSHRLDATRRCGDALEMLGPLDTALDGAALTSWLLLRIHVGALNDLGDLRIAMWLGQLAQGITADAARAADLEAAIELWRGEPSPRHRTLAIAARELAVCRLDAALGLARSEVQLAREDGEWHVAAEGAWIAGEALAGLGRFEEAARALADAMTWWPGREGLGQVALGRSEVLRPLGRWAEAAALLGDIHIHAHTPWDRAAAMIGLAALANDCGHPAQATRWLAAVDAVRLGCHTRLAVAHQVEVLRAAALAGQVDRAHAAAAEPLVRTLHAANRHAQAARISAWQAAVAWRPGAETDAMPLLATALEVLQSSEHQAWWAEAATLATWLHRASQHADELTPVTVSEPDAAGVSGRTIGTEISTRLADFIATSKAWPFGMRAALAVGDVAGAWQMATRFLAHLDSAQAAAIELAPWAVRARNQTSPERST
jgi:hypothetical protein